MVVPLEESIPSSFPCPEGDIFSLPTKADLINAFNEIASLPGKLDAKLEEMKAEKREEIIKLKEKLKDPNLSAEERASIEEQISIAETYVESVLMGTLRKEINDVIKQIEDFIDTLASALSPWWKSDGRTRDFQKEARDAFTELLQEFHMFIPIKISEIVSKLVPISFTIPIMGLSVDILKLVTSPSYQQELIDQMSGKQFLDQINKKYDEIAKLKEKLSDPNLSAEEKAKIEEQLAKLNADILNLEDLRLKLVDKFFSLVPEEFRQFDGEFGVLDPEAKAKIAFKYLKTEVKKYIQNWHVAAFQKLIKIFDEIWDLLGLPDLPFSELKDILSLDVGALIKKAIQSIKDKFKELEKLFLGEIGTIDKRIEEINKKLEDDKLSSAERQALLNEREELQIKRAEVEKRLLDERQKFNEQVLEAIQKLNIFGYDLRAIIGGEIKSTTESVEEAIADLSLELEDFKLNWHKKIFFSWVKIIKKFLSAIGLSALFKPLFLTFCDILKLIGMPFGIAITLPAIGGVINSSSKGKPASNSGLFDRVVEDMTSKDVEIADGDGSTDTYSLPSEGGATHVFVDGQKKTLGILGLGDYTISGDNVVFNSAPSTGASISIIRM